MNDGLPVGPLVAEPSPCELPDAQPLEGRTIRLERPDAARDAAPLFDATHGEDADPGQWTYMAYGPFESADAMRSVMESLVEGSTDPQWWLVRELSSGAPVGLAAFMNMVPDHRRLELGHIWYSPAAQRTAVNTETRKNSTGCAEPPMIAGVFRPQAASRYHVHAHVWRIKRQPTTGNAEQPQSPAAVSRRTI